jgi:hypothetical protein
VNPIEKMPEGIFGPTLSGKSTLAKALCGEFETQRGMRALVLDPHGEKWAPNSKVFTNEEKFWETVWAARRCVVVVEEASTTLRRDREFMPAFTRIRHNEHKLIVVGHNGTDLLPGMRRQLGTLYLFLQDPDAAAEWAKQMCDKRLLEAQNLQQYEFLKKVAYQAPRKMKLSL